MGQLVCTVVIPLLLAAMPLHSLYNHCPLHPVRLTAANLAILPPVVIGIVLERHIIHRMAAGAGRVLQPRSSSSA